MSSKQCLYLHTTFYFAVIACIVLLMLASRMSLMLLARYGRHVGPSALIMHFIASAIAFHTHTRHSVHAATLQLVSVLSWWAFVSDVSDATFGKDTVEYVAGGVRTSHDITSNPHVRRRRDLGSVQRQWRCSSWRSCCCAASPHLAPPPPGARPATAVPDATPRPRRCWPATTMTMTMMHPLRPGRNHPRARRDAVLPGSRPCRLLHSSQHAAVPPPYRDDMPPPDYEPCHVVEPALPLATETCPPPAVPPPFAMLGCGPASDEPQCI